METVSGTAHTVYLLCALAGTLFFLIKVLMAFVFGLADSDANMDVHHGADAHGVSGNETLHSYRVVSSYSLSAFAMTFGWAGLAFSEQLHLGQGISLILSFAVGVAIMFFIALTFHGMSKLTTTGSVFLIEKLPGSTATVYERIPLGGTGIIQISFEGMLKEVRAISADGKEIASHTEVKVERVIDGAVVAVRPLSAY